MSGDAAIPRRRRARAAAFGAWLRQEIEACRRTPSSFGRRIGVSSAAVQAWVSGQHVPTPESCEAIAHGLDIDVAEVLARAGHQATMARTEPDNPRRGLHELIDQLDPADEVTNVWLDSLRNMIAGIYEDQVERKKARTEQRKT